MKFIRFGVLSPQKQISYGQDSFHAAPCKKGFYAFPKNYVEKFLLGATNNPTNSSSKSYWIKDDNGNKIPSVDYDWDPKTDEITYPKSFMKILKKQKIKKSQVSSVENKKDGKYYMIAYKKPHIFNYDGEVWHHHYDVLHMTPMIGSWVKTDIETYKKALKLLRHLQKSDFLSNWGYDENILKSDSLNLYVKDHLEIFIEKIK
jgi:hypothetical protein